MDDFSQVPPKESLVPACDVHVAWDGHFLEQPDLPIYIEAASIPVGNQRKHDRRWSGAVRIRNGEHGYAEVQVSQSVDSSV